MINDHKYSINNYVKSQDAPPEKSPQVYGQKRLVSENDEFMALCQKVMAHFQAEIFEESERQDMKESLENQKKSIIGHSKEVQHKLGEIKKCVEDWRQQNTPYPPWYQDLVTGIYHENYGLAGMAEWFSPKFSNSTSAKIIGESIYFLENGRMVKKLQTMSKERRDRLMSAFLMDKPEIRKDEPVYEVYRIDGTRISILTEMVTKKGQETFTFRRYIIPEYTFEQQVKRHTIPEGSVPLFKAMIRLGFNVIFTGPVRTAKTTFLSTWQKYEDPDLEGVMIETDPEIPLHVIMPGSPIIQIVADGETLSGIIKPIMRSDADYIILAEARDGIALEVAVRAANKGTRRVKATYHTSDPYDLCYDIAAEIIKISGGILEHTMVKVAKSFDYIFSFVTLKDKNEKRLSGIYELRYDPDDQKIKVVQICKYDYQTDSWHWHYAFSMDKIRKGEPEGLKALEEFRGCLSYMATGHPMQDVTYQLCELEHPLYEKEARNAGT